ncbi:uncharacterized protein EI90DRAFT_3069503 [Cantharellus anzutake]|uniref:uncharacterized protein n=1 Tax=Cantharellus anzutake TaxID=1750568 RepID=UPI001904F2BB|nr:uncharacterized protein EI90DRAFT_3069503 [Cantharellus anzutake]KAF8326521.1 hypothetical protein EI90DRAFT_3069503 [Cantharellus anzutake]
MTRRPPVRHLLSSAVQNHYHLHSTHHHHRLHLYPKTTTLREEQHPLYPNATSLAYHHYHHHHLPCPSRLFRHLGHLNNNHHHHLLRLRLPTSRHHHRRCYHHHHHQYYYPKSDRSNYRSNRRINNSNNDDNINVVWSHANAQTGCNDVAGWGRTPPICNLLRKSPTTPGSVTVHSDSTATPNTAATTASGYGNSDGPLTPSSASSPGNTTAAYVHSGGLKNAGGMSIPTIPPVLSPYSPTFHLYSSNYAHARERGDHHASPRSPFPLSAGTGTGTGNSPHHLTIPPAVVVVPRSGRGATVSISKKLRGGGGGIGFSSSDRHMGREIIPDGPISTPLVNVSNGTGAWRTLR